jgi:hypothetical protein
MKVDVAVITGNRYYVYEWFRPGTGECFYTGKGSGQRAWSFYSRNHQFMRILDELYEKKLYPSVHIYRANLTSKEALKIERARMAYWAGRFIKLSNSTGTYRKNLKRLRRLRNRPTPEVIARVRRIFG